ncbi:hypothetical protein ATANTOWER_014079 [Ataeniobius toweri]|uniref:Uncharacterized protein n=1 Tax=Ataeniobius toweri TaxID=208326 RepID=A0ABU7BPL6_9TELE|nr:hypothetical protein [Ataeniobius toweri]
MGCGSHVGHAAADGSKQCHSSSIIERKSFSVFLNYFLGGSRGSWCLSPAVYGQEAGHVFGLWEEAGVPVKPLETNFNELLKHVSYTSGITGWRDDMRSNQWSTCSRNQAVVRLEGGQQMWWLLLSMMPRMNPH